MNGSCSTHGEVFLLGSIDMFRLVIILFLGFASGAARAAGNECSPYSANEMRVFAYSAQARVAYSATMLSQQRFRITLNLDFGNRTDMRRRVQKCYAEYNQRFASSRGIELHLYEPTDKGPAPERFPIEIDPKLGRPNANAYTGTEPCSSYIHESLHHAGLWDEYEEKETSAQAHFWGLFETWDHSGVSTGRLPGFDCRAKSDSIMSANRPYDRATSRTPLRPAHIRQLLWPTCKSLNITYRACVKNAYATSKNAGGAGCYDVPAVCSTFNEWLK